MIGSLEKPRCMVERSTVCSRVATAGANVETDADDVEAKFLGDFEEFRTLADWATEFVREAAN